MAVTSWKRIDPEFVEVEFIKNGETDKMLMFMEYNYYEASYSPPDKPQLAFPHFKKDMLIERVDNPVSQGNAFEQTIGPLTELVYRWICNEDFEEDYEGDDNVKILVPYYQWAVIHIRDTKRPPSTTPLRKYCKFSDFKKHRRQRAGNLNRGYYRTASNSMSITSGLNKAQIKELEDQAIRDNSFNEIKILTGNNADLVDEVAYLRNLLSDNEIDFDIIKGRKYNNGDYFKSLEAKDKEINKLRNKVEQVKGKYDARLNEIVDIKRANRDNVEEIKSEHNDELHRLNLKQYKCNKQLEECKKESNKLRSDIAKNIMVKTLIEEIKQLLLKNEQLKEKLDGRK